MLLSGVLLTSRFFFKDAHQTFLDMTDFDICYRRDDEFDWNRVFDEIKCGGPIIKTSSTAIEEACEEARLCCCKEKESQHQKSQTDGINIIWDIREHRVLIS